LFGFKSTYSKEDPFAIILSDQARNVNRNTFDQELSRLQRFYDLAEWSP
jgi:protein SOV1